MKKGFTILEVLGVVIILALLFAISVPMVSKVIYDSKVNLYKKNEQVLVKAADLFALKNQSYYPNEIGESKEIRLRTLQEHKYISSIVNPQDSEQECRGYVLITKIAPTEYDFTPHLKCGVNINTVEEDGLIGYWKLNSNAIDYSKNSNIGIINGTTPTANRHNENNSALSFESGDFIEFDNSVFDLIDGEQEATLLMWIKLNSGSPGVAASGIIQLSGFESTNGNLYPYQGNRLYLDVFRSNRLGPIYYPGHDLTDWHLLVVSSKPGVNGWNLYLNGELIHSTSGLTQIYASYMTFRLGNNSASRWLTGSLSDVRIYKRALSSDEIKLIYESEK